MPDERITDRNDIRAAVIAVAEVVREQVGLELRGEEMPDPNDHHLFSWMQGRKWFDIGRVRANARETIRRQGLASEDWEGVFRLLIPEIIHVCFVNEDGMVVVSPWNDGYDF